MHNPDYSDAHRGGVEIQQLRSFSTRIRIYRYPEQLTVAVICEEIPLLYDSTTNDGAWATFNMFVCCDRIN